MTDTLTAAALFPRRELAGTYATPVRSDGWRATDLEGQAAARELAELGAVGVYVNVFGVAFGTIDGVPVILSTTSPARYYTVHEGPDWTGVDAVTAADDYTYAVVTRRDWTVRTGGFCTIVRDADAHGRYFGTFRD